MNKYILKVYVLQNLIDILSLQFNFKVTVLQNNIIQNIKKQIINGCIKVLCKKKKKILIAY